MQKVTIFLGAMLGLVLWLPGAQAHHAFSSEFDADRPFLVTGTIVKVEWINPHSWVHVDVATESGEVVPCMMGHTQHAVTGGSYPQCLTTWNRSNRAWLSK